MEKEFLFRSMDERAAEFEAMSDAIWEYAEPAFHEHRSAGLQMDFLRKEGFRITTPVGGMNTAFIAEYGAGKPVIAILGEYDALPGLSQKADVMHQEPIPGATAGHGCGHHLLGTAGVEAACAVKKLLADGSIKGTIRYYGCPAEEGGGGKVYMIRDGAFADADAALSFHPMNTAWFFEDLLSVVISKFRFQGRAAHAAAAPHMGRSALDAAELMNIGTQFLREHITSDCRIHYAFLDAGGPKPNVVQDKAEVIYVVRSREMDNTRDVFGRICDIAKGAALMTGTEVFGPTITAAYANSVANDTLRGLCEKVFSQLFPCDFSEEDTYGRAFNQAISGKDRGYIDAYTPGIVGGSTDVSDVSWVVPTVCITTPTYTADTQLHNWAATAQGKSAGAHKGMHLAAKVMAACAIDLCENPVLVESAREELNRRLDGRIYQSLLPEDARPPQY